MRRTCALKRFLAAALWATLLSPLQPCSSAEPRLFEAPPYDQITLKDKNVIHVSPIEFPGGKRPDNPKPTDKLIVRLVDEPAQEYELHWRDIVEIKPFDKLILDEGDRLVGAGKFADAFDYFDYLERNRPALAELKQSIERYLFADAKDCQRRKQYAEVLAVLDELHRRNSSYPGLDRAWGAATDKVLESLVADKDHAGARARLFQLMQRFPTEPNAVKWKARFESEAQALVEQAQASIGAGELHRARREVFAALERWPADEAARKLALELYAQAPALNVGVMQPWPGPGRDPLTEWSARRVAPLLDRSLLELDGFGAEGGVYRSPLGDFSVGELGLELNVRLRPGLRRIDGESYTGYDLSQYLVQLTEAQPDSLLAQLLDRVTVRGVYDVDIRLQRQHVRPEALLDQPLRLRHPEDGSWTLAALPPYRVGERSPAATHFLANPVLREGMSSGPTEIVEQPYATMPEALGALERGEILLLDRLNPWHVTSTRAKPGVVVEPYAVPTVHVLAPNLDRPLMARRLFRRALVYGINREAILRVQLLRGGEMPDTRVTSGPFPIGYAYNDQIEVRPYEPRLAMTLAEIAIKEMLAANAPAADPAAPAPSPSNEAQAAGGDDVAAPADAEHESHAPREPIIETIRLAHPPTEVARIACRAISKQWKLLGLPVELVELKSESPEAAVKKYDLVYVELQVEEPIADARRLFGSGGLASGSSPHLEEALTRLEAAADWKTARDALQRLHRVVAEDVSIIPLWQMGEHFAYRGAVQGVSTRPVTLYQNVEQWRAAPYLPEAPK